MPSAAYVLARSVIRNLPEGLTAEERALRALHGVIRQTSGAILQVMHEEDAGAVVLSAEEPVKSLGKVAMIMAGVSPKAEDYAITDQARGSYVLLEPNALRDRSSQGDGGSELAPKRVGSSERFAERKIVLERHDLLVSLVGEASVYLVDDDKLVGRAVPSNTVALIRFRAAKGKLPVHKIFEYLASALPKLVKQIRASGKLRITLKDLERLPIPVRLLGKK